MLLFIVVAAAGGFGWAWLFPSDEAQIEDTLHRVAAALSNANGQGKGSGLEGLARVAGLQNEFAADAQVDAGPPFAKLTGRQDIVAAAARVVASVRNLEVRFPDIDTEVAGDRLTAASTVTAEARFDEASGARAIDARELAVTFTRVDGRWLIQSVTSVAPLQRLDTP